MLGRIDLSSYKLTADLGISSLPGCKFKDTWRSLKADINTIRSAGVKDIIVLCTKGELKKYRVKNLFSEYEASELVVHHCPFNDGEPMAMSDLVPLLEKLTDLLTKGHKTLIHCYGGLGRSSLIVCCFLMYLDCDIEPAMAIEKLQSLRGSSAIQSIKQYNFINEFPENLKDFKRRQRIEN